MLKRTPVLLCVAVAAISLAMSHDAFAETTEAVAAAPQEESAQPAAEADEAAPVEEPRGEEPFDDEKAMVRGKMVYAADRGIILPLGTGEARVDLFVGLNKGMEGRVFGVGSALASERTAGLTFRGTLWGPFEMGMSLQYLQTLDNGKLSRAAGNFDGTITPPSVARGPEGDGTRRIAGYGYKMANGYNQLVPAYLYGRFKVVEQFGVEIGLQIPTMQAEGFNRPTLRFGFPVQWIAVPGLLKLHFRPDLLIGFGSTALTDTALLDTPVNVGFYFDAGITISVAKIYFDVTMGYGVDIYPYRAGYVPLSMVVGYQALTRLDVYVGITLENMTPEFGGAGDARSIQTGFQCRF
jgi:hypothetical protein